ncbi:MAG: hypothetical protein CMJ48_14280 [Planctomycetaceae bacterium]|nr:hypothetical protein [Planctomycetaceae bacterium]
MAKLCRLICAFALLSGTALADEPVAVSEKIAEKQALARPLGEWIEQLRDGDAKRRAEAAAAIDVHWSHSGPDLDAFEGGEVEKDVEARRDEFRKQVSQHADTILALLRDPKFEYRLKTESLLLALDRRDGRLIGKLEKVALDNSRSFTTRHTAVSVLMQIQPIDRPVGPILFKVLSNLEPHTQAWFEWCAGERKSISIEVARRVLSERLSQDPEMTDETRQEIVSEYLKTPLEQRMMGLGFYVPTMQLMLYSAGHTAVEVPWIIKLTGEEFPGAVRLMALMLLGELRAESRPAIPQFRKLLKDKNKMIRGAAASSLIRIEKDRKTIPKVARALGKSIEEIEEEWKFVFDAVDARKQFVREVIERPDAGEIALLDKMLDPRSGAYKRFSLRFLIDIAPVAKSALPRIRELLKDEDPETRRVARKAIAAIEGAGRK